MNLLFRRADSTRYKNSIATCTASYEFSTMRYLPKDQFTAFADEYSAFGVVHPAEEAQLQEGFLAKRTGYRLGELKVVLSETQAYCFHGVRRFQPRIGAGWVLILRLSGKAEIENAGVSAVYEGHHVEVRHVGQVCSGRLSANKTMFLYLSRSTFRGLEHVLDRLAEANDPALVHPLLASYLSSLARLMPTLPRADEANVAEATLSMVRACLSYAPGLLDLAKAPTIMTRFESARRYIDQNLRSPSLSVDSVADALSMSRRQLYKLFEQHGGVQRFIQARRLDACFDALVRLESNQSISSVAEELCFADLPRFRKSFRDRFQLSPRDLCMAAALAPAPSPFEQWLYGDNDSLESLPNSLHPQLTKLAR